MDRSNGDAGFQISDCKGWNLSGMLRGQRGAETAHRLLYWALGAHTVGDVPVLIVWNLKQ